jgi:ABC-2 type transport system permease protein
MLTIYVDEQPTEVGIDPYNKLIDTISDDNRRTAQENGSSGEQ